MATPTISPWRPITLFIIALILLLGAGTLVARQAYLTRGISSGLPEPITHGGVEVGVNVDFAQYDDGELEAALQRIGAAGIRHIKQSFFYAQEYDWSESDRIFSALQRHDLQLSALLDGDPGENYAPPDDLADFASWVGEFARRYGSRIHFYFIWDEPNLTSHWGLQPANPAEYAALLSVSAHAIRSNDSEAVVVAAPLAPTTETGPANLADALYLQGMYAAGAADFFDVAAGKPYGFHSSPHDRTISLDTLNFSRAILLREVMVQNGDGDKALFAGNWGWNSLPPDWAGPPSIWGQVDAEERVVYTEQAAARARFEWPWMGLMFLETWQASAPEGDPRHGFDIEAGPLESALPELLGDPQLAYPGFHFAAAQEPAQEYVGDWRFLPLYGADIGATGDRLTFRFWGSAVGLRVRRADYRARLYVTVDGEPAEALPQDETGAALVLTAPDPADDFLDMVPVAENLEPGPHVLNIEAYRGWDQWALNGLSVGYYPDTTAFRLALVALLVAATLFAVAGFSELRLVSWADTGSAWLGRWQGLSERVRLILTVLAAGLVTLTGWLTWGEQAAGIYRRLPDNMQLLMTAAAASIFYVAPTFLVYLPALVILFFFIYARPAWGLALVAFTFPFFVVPKPMLGYRFSPVEIFVLLTAAATMVTFAARSQHQFLKARRDAPYYLPPLRALWLKIKERLVAADYAVLFFVFVATTGLFFTERLDVAQNEWRVVIVEPALFYLLLRAIRPSSREMWTILDAFVLGGVVVAAYGLWQYLLGQNVITVPGGLGRLRSIYGSPNNVALYLGRILPFLFALLLMGSASRLRRILYSLALLPVGVALVLTFSKGALFLGVPAGVGLVLLLWIHSTRRVVWPWLVAGALVLIALAVAVLSIPGLAARLDLQGTTSILRLSLWQASLNMFLDHPLFGVGLDNFLYAYRGRYILESAWEEPNLSHPHNIALDFATRLGLAGIVAGVWLLAALVRNLWRLPRRLNEEWRPMAIAVAGSLAQMLSHGLVDHSIFLIDLSYVFFFLLGISVWLRYSDNATIGRLPG